MFGKFGHRRYTLSTCGIILGAALFSTSTAAPQSPTTALDPAATVDPYQADTWCSLPKSSMDDFVARETRRKPNAGNEVKTTPRDREIETVGVLRRMAVTMDGGLNLSDALIRGHLSIKTASGQASIPVTYMVTRDGKEKIITEFKGAKTVAIASGGHTQMKIGSHPISLSPATMEDHQILVLPQWSLVQRHSDESYGVKRFTSTRDLDVIQILPPERSSRLEQSLIPSTPSCIAFNPNSLLISRIERIVRPENQLTREHRQSVVYTDYQLISGVFVPKTQTRYHDGILRDVFTIDSVSFNNNFLPAEFTWPSN